MGGEEIKSGTAVTSHQKEIRELAFSSDQKLRVLALEAVARNFESLAPEVTKLPNGLRSAVEDRIRRKHVIS